MKLWGFERNIPFKVMMPIVAHVRKRALSGKETDVLHRDKRIPKTKIQNFERKNPQIEPSSGKCAMSSSCRPTDCVVIPPNTIFQTPSPAACSTVGIPNPQKISTKHY